MKTGAILTELCAREDAPFQAFEVQSCIFTYMLSEFCSDFHDPRFLAAQFDHARSTGHIVQVIACSLDVLSNPSNANRI